MEFVVSRVQDNSTGVLQLLGERGELIAAEKIFFFIHVVFYIITRPVSDRRWDAGVTQMLKAVD